MSAEADAGRRWRHSSMIVTFGSLPRAFRLLVDSCVVLRVVHGSDRATKTNHDIHSRTFELVPVDSISSTITTTAAA